LCSVDQQPDADGDFGDSRKIDECERGWKERRDSRLEER